MFSHLCSDCKVRPKALSDHLPKDGTLTKSFVEKSSFSGWLLHGTCHKLQHEAHADGNAGSGLEAFKERSTPITPITLTPRLHDSTPSAPFFSLSLLCKEADRRLRSRMITDTTRSEFSTYAGKVLTLA